MDLGPYWSLDARTVLARLGSSAGGLSSEEAERRLATVGPNELRAEKELTRLRVLWAQLKSPLLLLLLFAAGASALTGEWVDAGVVIAIVLASVGVGYSREYRAHTEAAKLQARIRTSARVLRDSGEVSLPLRALVPGDVVVLGSGSMVPADALLIDSTDCFADEALLTGESFPVEKRPGVVPKEAPLAKRTNVLLLGTSVVTGAARAVVVRTGGVTEFGSIAHRLKLRPPETEFDRGIRRFGMLLAVAMLVMVIVVFAANVLLGRPAVDTLLFAIALAVGLSPELLPAILSVNLARGAAMMARHGVLVRRLNAIENLGSMDVLCTDKTGTLTEGVVRRAGSFDLEGRPSDEPLRLAVINAALSAGAGNPLDHAILEGRPAPTARKVGEIPYDFQRKRVSVVVEEGGQRRLITKGAVTQVLEVCDLEDRTSVEERVRDWNAEGIRVLAVAERTLAAGSWSRDDERELTLVGFLTFVDQPKDGVDVTLRELAALGVTVKLITGDSALVARHVATQVGMPGERLLTGEGLDALTDSALLRVAEQTAVFAEVDPRQKERILLALKKLGHVVGFMGDGINDVPAMHAADVSLSVDQATDVAKEAADFVLIERQLDVIRRGVEAGRRTFANTLKYVLTTTSANLGNMASMAVASFFLPFLPLLAGQILLNNFLSDIPAIGLADDAVDPELVDKPRRWSLKFIARFMVVFGALSSLFDLVTFAVLLKVFTAAAPEFRTAWFTESLLTELVIALVVRTRRPFFKSRPGRLLLWSSLAVGTVTFVIPYVPGASALGFTPLPLTLVLAVAGITCAYVAATEGLKVWFYRRPE